MFFCSHTLQLESTVSMKRIRSLTVRLLTICLVLCLCLAAVTPVFAAENNINTIIQKLMAVFDLSQSDYDNYDRNYAASVPIVYDQKSSSHYVAMGGISAGGLAVVGTNNCYSAQVHDKLGIQYTNIADYELNAAGAVSYVKSFSDTVKKADLITFQLDAAPFILACVNNALDSIPVVWDAYITDPALISSMRSFRTQLVNDYSSTYGQASAESIAFLVEHLLYECVAYCFETVNATKEIRKYNSNAVVLVLGLYNPLRNLVFNAGTQSLDISSIMDQMISFCNVFLLKNISSIKNTAFIEACDTSTTGFGAITINPQDESALYKELFKIVNASNKQYANKAGHDDMCNQILNSLIPPCKHPNATVKNSRAASCKEEGYTGDTVCSTCNTIIRPGTSIPKTDHKYGTGTITTKPGCETAGVKTYRCTNSGCTQTKTESVLATGHKYDTGSVTTKPGCETEGVKTYRCTNSGCKKTKTEAVLPTGHKYDTGSVTTKPGCETEGVRTYHCTNSGCKKTKTEAVLPTGHKYDTGSVTTKPGCETEGVKTYRCINSGCKKTKTETVPPTGHSFNQGTVLKEPGCETEGEKAVTCIVCNKDTTEVIPATGHTWDKGVVTTEPGCETEGEKAFTCTVCSKETTEVIPATGHTWNEGTVTTEPGCETEGLKTFICTVCSKESSEVSPAAGHTWDEGTITTEPGCETEGIRAVTCIICGKATTQPVSPTGHSYGSYTSNDDATCQKDGTKTAVCVTCGASDTQDDPGTQKEHIYSKGICSFCGAEKPTNSTLWWILIPVLVVATAAAGFLFFLKWRKQKVVKN